MDSDNRHLLILRAFRIAGGQLDRATIKVLPCLNDWRECKCKRDQCRCEYVVSIFHVIYFPSCFGFP
jgi:hypothetical protein